MNIIATNFNGIARWGGKIYSFCQKNTILDACRVTILHFHFFLCKREGGGVFGDGLCYLLHLFGGDGVDVVENLL